MREGEGEAGGEGEGEEKRGKRRGKRRGEMRKKERERPGFRQFTTLLAWIESSGIVYFILAFLV